ncbi:SIS domain-containing protein [Longispora albida]|uniref:SIS domain-containing protein n=1 Tax=Longispora albida TaxID=203523 RepID=UPI00036A2FD1|nr:SIS domain-containing protein [Longispora albida]
MSYVEQEIASQPGCWTRAAEVARDQAQVLPSHGERIAVVGCGTSWFMAQAYAVLREQAGHGETDAFAASEFPAGRAYDRVVVISRSGTTTEVLDLLRALTVPTVAIIGDPESPGVTAADAAIVLDFADEKSVVQTRFATSVLALLRASLGEDLAGAVKDAEAAVTAELPFDVTAVQQITFLGRGWTYGLANEAGLKCREAATFWTESYPAMEYRHGPISIAAPGRVTWAFGEVPAGLREDVAKTGATFVHSDLDPMADLVLAQRVAVAIAQHRGLDPDEPRHLTRSVILDG